MCFPRVMITRSASECYGKDPEVMTEKPSVPLTLVLVAQCCPTVCDLMDCSSPSSFVHGILQARILEWEAIPFSRGSS